MMLNTHFFLFLPPRPFARPTGSGMGGPVGNRPAEKPVVNRPHVPAAAGGLPGRAGPAPAHDQPPTAKGRHGQAGRLVGNADDHIAIIGGDIEDAHGDGSCHGPAGKVVTQDQPCVLPPTTADILEIAHPLLLLRIDANHGPAMSYVQPPQTDQVAELPVTVGMADTGPLLAAGSQRGTPVSQQARHRMGRHLRTVVPQGLAEFPQRALCPFQASDPITRRGILQKLLQGPHDPGCFSSTRLRPAPRRRLRPASDRFVWPNSRWPRAIVLRSLPVIRSSRAMPPRPRCRAKKPAKSRRRRSSAAASSWLMVRCSRATALRGWCWQIEQGHTWTSGRWSSVFMGPYLDDPAAWNGLCLL